MFYNIFTCCCIDCVSFFHNIFTIFRFYILCIFRHIRVIRSPCECCAISDNNLVCFYSFYQFAILIVFFYQLTTANCCCRNREICLSTFVFITVVQFCITIQRNFVYASILFQEFAFIQYNCIFQCNCLILCQTALFVPFDLFFFCYNQAFRISITAKCNFNTIFAALQVNEASHRVEDHCRQTFYNCVKNCFQICCRVCCCVMFSVCCNFFQHISICFEADCENFNTSILHSSCLINCRSGCICTIRIAVCQQDNYFLCICIAATKNTRCFCETSRRLCTAFSLHTIDRFYDRTIFSDIIFCYWCKATRCRCAAVKINNRNLNIAADSRDIRKHVNCLCLYNFHSGISTAFNDLTCYATANMSMFVFTTYYFIAIFIMLMRLLRTGQTILIVSMKDFPRFFVTVSIATFIMSMRFFSTNNVIAITIPIMAVQFCITCTPSHGTRRVQYQYDFYRLRFDRFRCCYTQRDIVCTIAIVYRCFRKCRQCITITSYCNRIRCQCRCAFRQSSCWHEPNHHNQCHEPCQKSSFFHFSFLLSENFFGIIPLLCPFYALFLNLLPRLFEHIP